MLGLRYNPVYLLRAIRDLHEPVERSDRLVIESPNEEVTGSHEARCSVTKMRSKMRQGLTQSGRKSAWRLILLAGVLLVLVGSRSKPELPTLAETQNAYRWFDTLGYPALTGRAYLRVATGWWSRRNNDAPTNTYLYAFLLQEAGDQFTVFTTDLRTLTFVKTSADTEDYKRVGYEVVDLLLGVKTRLEEVAQQLEKVGLDLLDWNRQLGVRSELFVLARACAANELDGLAYQVYEYAVDLPDPHTGEINPRPLLSIIQDEIAYATIWRDTLDFGDLAIPRQELLSRSEQFLVHFSASEYAPRASEAVALLRQMVKEDEGHVRETNPITLMTPDERIAELIFQLRDQHGHQWGQPGGNDIFSDERGEASPAQQLVKIGYPAIPQLITALDDRRFTRSVEYWRDFVFSHHVLRVGDVALIIIERIANRSFYALSSTTSALTDEERRTAAKAQVLAWWQDFQAKGEKQVLIEAVEKGDENSPAQAEVLIEKYPEVALDAVTIGLRAATKWWPHSQLVAAAAHLKGESIIPLLISIARRGPYLSSRLAAAQAVYRRDRPEGLAAMIQEWLTPGPSNADEFHPEEDLINFLAASGDPEAIQALGQDLPKRPIKLRVVLIFALGRDVCAEASSPPARNCKSPQAVTATEELLLQALDDTKKYTGSSGTWQGKSYYSPRVCDLAGYALALRWPDRYTFDLEASLIERNRQIVELKNIWRGTQGLAPLPLPPLPEIPAVPDEIVQPLLDQLLQLPAEDGRQISDQIEALGLGALPAVRRKLTDLAADHPARPRVIALATRLANIVREIDLEPESIEPKGSLAEHLAALKGQSLSSRKIVDLVLDVTRGGSPGSTGIDLEVDRAGDNAGVLLTIQLTTVNESIGCWSRDGGWSYSYLVTEGNSQLLNSFGCDSAEFGQTEEADVGLIKALDKALAALPEETLAIYLKVVKQPF